MRPDDLLGQREHGLLEFKAADALKNLSKLAREVVAMLNASDGKAAAELWIGVVESESMAVKLEGVEEAQREQVRLRDHLVDTIEPRPAHEEVSVDEVAAGDGRRLLSVSVCCGAQRKPFALNRDGRHYLTRVQSRIALLTYDELRDLWSARSASVGDDERNARAWLRTQRENACAKPSEVGVLWIGVASPGRPPVDLNSESVRRLLTVPNATGNRVDGWTFLSGRGAVVPTQHGVRVGQVEWGATDVTRDGWLSGSVSLERLRYRDRRGVASLNEFNPYALVEYLTSVVRLAAALARMSHCDSDYYVSIAITGAAEWVLWPYSPSSIGWKDSFHGIGRFDDSADLVLDPPFEFKHAELAEPSDACAYRLLVRIYESFHLGADKLPREFDPVSLRLMLD